MIESWIKNTGKNINIAIIDSGIDSTHPFFKNVKIYQYFPQDRNFKEELPYDNLGHGTACAGLIHKLAKKSRLYMLKCMDEDGTARGENIVSALKWCINNDIHIVNLSCGAIENKYENELCELGEECVKKGIIVFAACHDSGFCGIPAKLNGFLPVMGKSIKGRYNFYYNNGKFVANGGRQIVCWLDKKFVYADGSSFATARMTGIAAKIMEGRIDKGRDEIISLLINNALKEYELKDTVIHDEIIEANSKFFQIKKAAIYSYNKEMHALVNFKNLLNFEIISIIEPPKKIFLNANENQICGIPCYKDLTEESLKNVDTLIISKMSVYEELLQKDLLKIILDKALLFGLNIYILEYIDKSRYPEIFAEAYRRKLKIRHPMIGYEEYDISQLYREHYGHIGTKTPVIGIFGTGVSQGKFTVQLKLRELLRERGLRVNNFGTETHCELFGFESFCPLEMDSSIRFPREQIMRYIQGEIRRLEIDNKPDIVLVGGQSGVVPYSYAFPEDEYTLPTISVLMASIPHAYILCINFEDDIQFIKDTVNVMEGIGKGKLIAIVSSKIRKKYSQNASKIKKEIVSENEYQTLRQVIYANLKVPLYDIASDKDANKLADCVINYFS